MSAGNSAFNYRLVTERDFDAIRPLWEKLKAYTLARAGRFEEDVRRHAYEPRKRELLAKGAAGKIRIEIASEETEAVDIAYCVSTISAEGRGEVDSIFVEEPFRGCGIGSELLRRALSWLDGAGATAKVISIAHGNDEAMAFYGRFGFYPRAVVVQHSEDSAE
jgi:GNAT superfamily N-acetyltransferase